MANNYLCKNCKNLKCLLLKKPCKKIELFLKHFKIYSVNYIRPQLSTNYKQKQGNWREIPFSTLKFNENIYDGGNFK